MKQPMLCYSKIDLENKVALSEINTESIRKIKKYVKNRIRSFYRTIATI